MNDEQILTNENAPSRLPRGLGRLIILTVVVSLVTGMVGGVLGFWYAQERGILPALSSSGSIVNQVKLEEDSAVIDVVKKASPAVVSIVVSKDLNNPGLYGEPFGFSPFFSVPSGPDVRQVGAGTGFFVSKDGLILTNKHVVSDENASYSVLTNDGKRYDAKVLARDPVSDLAIVKVDISEATVLELVDSANLQVGQRVIAIGNSLGQYQNTVTTGVISGIGRSIVAGGGGETEQLEGVIQTDAAINPGNSGGPLLNSLGQVIGINTAVDQEGQLVGFAIPSSEAKKAIDSFNRNGKITRAFLGVRYMMITQALASSQGLPRDFGALIVRGEQRTDFAVLPGGPADKAGLMENDIILECDGKRLDEDTSLSRCIKAKDVGDTLSLKIYHRGEEKTVQVRLEEAK